MKPYGHEQLGGFASKHWTDLGPYKPHTVTVAGDAEINRAAARRYPKRVARIAAKRLIEEALEEENNDE